MRCRARFQRTTYFAARVGFCAASFLNFDFPRDFPGCSNPVLSAQTPKVFPGCFAFLANCFGFPAYPWMSIRTGAATFLNYCLVRRRGPW